jgi:hypothetical protein
MTDLGETEPDDGRPDTPPKRNREATRKESWFDLKFSHFVEIILTVALVGIACLQYTVYVRQAEIMQTQSSISSKQNEISERTLIAGQRAWIQIDEIGLGGGALAFDKNGASVSVSFKITDVGNSPAISITPHAWLVVLKNGGPFALQEQQRMCSEIRKGPFGLGFTLFPDQTFPTNIGLGGWSLGTNISLDEIKKGLETSADGEEVALQVFGCVDYTFVTDPKTHHQTGFIRDLRRRGRPDPIRPGSGNIVSIR